MASKTDKMTPTKPKRPLSAYNLFYRYKRVKVLEAHSGKNNGYEISIQDIITLVETTPGLENCPLTIQSLPQDKLNEIRQANIRKSLEPHLMAKDRTKRVHRRSSHGLKISFVEMNKIMLDSWKTLDKGTKSIFQALADEGRLVYQDKLKEYITYKHQAARDRIYQRALDIPDFKRRPSSADSSNTIASAPAVMVSPNSSFTFGGAQVTPGSSFTSLKASGTDNCGADNSSASLASRTCTKPGLSWEPHPPSIATGSFTMGQYQPELHTSDANFVTPVISSRPSVAAALTAVPTSAQSASSEASCTTKSPSSLAALVPLPPFAVEHRTTASKSSETGEDETPSEGQRAEGSVQKSVSVNDLLGLIATLCED